MCPCQQIKNCFINECIYIYMYCDFYECITSIHKAYENILLLIITVLSKLSLVSGLELREYIGWYRRFAYISVCFIREGQPDTKFINRYIYV